MERHGSPFFYRLLEEAAETHDRKSHDYASNNNPSGNYHFAGKMALMFSHSPEDAGFMGRLSEKIYRLANLESSGKSPKNENIQDTEVDIAVITCLWMADRRSRRETYGQVMDGEAHTPKLTVTQQLMDKMTNLPVDQLLVLSNFASALALAKISERKG